MTADEIKQVQRAARALSRVATEALFDLRHGLEHDRRHLEIRDKGRELFRLLRNHFGKQDPPTPPDANA